MAKAKKYALVGLTIKAVRKMTAKEMNQEGWDGGGAPTVIELSDGMCLYAMRDEEGNGPGVLVGRNTAGSIWVTPE